MLSFKHGRQLRELDSLDGPFLAVDGRAAGSNGATPFFHGRVDADPAELGISIQFDLVPRIGMGVGPTIEGLNLPCQPPARQLRHGRPGKRPTAHSPQRMGPKRASDASGSEEPSPRRSSRSNKCHMRFLAVSVLPPPCSVPPSLAAHASRMPCSPTSQPIFLTARQRLLRDRMGHGVGLGGLGLLGGLGGPLGTFPLMGLPSGLPPSIQAAGLAGAGGGGGGSTRPAGGNAANRGRSAQGAGAAASPRTHLSSMLICV
jgi:hypothetical protein